MEMLNSYFGIADNDLQYARACYSAGKSIGNFNVVASLCAQAAEKYMKAVIEYDFMEDPDVMNLMHSHNLRALYNRIIQKYELSTDSRSCKWLGDFYYDTMYPGDNFVTVNEQDANECIDIAEQLKSDVEKILFRKGMRDADARKSLKMLKAF